MRLHYLGRHGPILDTFTSSTLAKQLTVHNFLLQEQLLLETPVKLQLAILKLISV